MIENEHDIPPLTYDEHIVNTYTAQYIKENNTYYNYQTLKKQTKKELL